MKLCKACNVAYDQHSMHKATGSYTSKQGQVLGPNLGTVSTIGTCQNQSFHGGLFNFQIKFDSHLTVYRF
jgi:hypothetical protein